MSYAKQVAVYASYLRAGSEMAALIQANLTRGALPADLVAGFAQAHAKHYGCEVTQNADGAYKFKDANGERHGTAQQQWDRKIDPYHKRARSNRGGNRSKTEQVTPRKTARVSQLLAAFHDLSAAERAAFLADAK
jgi:hypothetical protein